LISFANDIGAIMVAEGIETPAELECLQGLGVCFGQGYYLSEPAPVAAA
jgi:EAL domain-containing protein (putative c-di-GMP-specific phosphodiesterase class I)